MTSLRDVTAGYLIHDRGFIQTGRNDFKHACMFNAWLEVGVDGNGTLQTDKKGCAEWNV